MGRGRPTGGAGTRAAALLLAVLLFACTGQPQIPPDPAATRAQSTPPPAVAATLAPTATKAPEAVPSAATKAATATPSAIHGAVITTVQPPAVHPAWSTWADVNEITQLVPAGDDTLWAATRGGIVRLDLNALQATVFGAEHGLPGGIVHSLALAADGTLWCGTDTALAWFDAEAERWHPIPLEAPGDPTPVNLNAVTALLADPSEDAIWAAASHGVVRCAPASLGAGAQTSCAPLPGLWRLGATARALLAEDDGTLWVGWGEGTVRYADGQAQPMEAMGGGPPTIVQDIQPDHAGGLWFATMDGAYHLDRRAGSEPTWTHLSEADGLVSPWVSSVLPLAPVEDQAQGVVWFGTEGGISRYDPNAPEDQRWTTLARGETPVGRGAAQILQLGLPLEAGGGLWFATDEGLWHLAGDRWQHYDVDGGHLPGDRVTWMTHIEGRGLYVGTNGGLAFYDGAAWMPLVIPTRVPGNDVMRLYGSPDGRVWMTRIGYSGAPGIARLEGDHFAPVELEGAVVWSGGAVLSFTDDAMWVGGGGQVARVDPARDVVLYQSNCLPGALHEPLLVRSDGTLYLSSDGGLAYPQGGQLMRVPIGLDIGYRRATCMLEDDDRALWVGTDEEGVFRWDTEGRWAHHPGPDPDHPDRVMALAQGDDGDVWIGTVAEGLRRLDPDTGSWTSYTVPDGLPSNAISALLADSQGRLWAGTPTGAALWQDGRWEAIPELSMGIRVWAEVRLSPEETQIWAGTDDGLWMQFEGGWLPCASLSQIAAVGGVSAVLQQEDGTVWLAADAGLVRRRPDGSCRLYREADGALLSGARSLQRTPDGILWIGVDTGMLAGSAHSASILRLDTSLPEEQDVWITAENCGPAGEYVTDVYEDSRGELWFPGFGGLSRYVNGEWVHEPADVLPEGRIHTLAEDAQGRLWAIGWTGVAVLADGVWGHPELPLPPDSAILLQVLVDHTGVLWFSVSERAHETAPGEDMEQGAHIWRWDGTAWQTYAWQSPRANPMVAPPMLLEQGDPPQLWALNNETLARYEAQTDAWITIPEPATGRAGMPSSAVVTRDGSLWIGTWDQGAFRLRYDAAEGTATWEQFTPLDGLAGQSVHSMLEDSAGVLWFVTDAGLSRFER